MNLPLSIFARLGGHLDLKLNVSMSSFLHECVGSKPLLPVVSSIHHSHVASCPEIILIVTSCGALIQGQCIKFIGRKCDIIYTFSPKRELFLSSLKRIAEFPTCA